MIWALCKCRWKSEGEEEEVDDVKKGEGGGCEERVASGERGGEEVGFGFCIVELGWRESGEVVEERESWMRR